MRGPTPPTPPGYELLTPIGHGERSVVWKAVELSTGRWIALKILDADIDDTRTIAERRIDPVRRAMAALADRAGIVAIHDAGVHEGRSWVATELCRRGSLAAHVATTGALDVGGALVVVAQLADALAAAHEAGVVHGDVTPANIMLTDHGEPALRDIGLARGHPGPTADRPDLDHLAPELLAGEAPSPRSDVYALGTTVWELLAGSPPTVPDVPPPVFALLSAMAAPSPDERVPSMTEVARRSRSVASELGLSPEAGLALPPLPALDLLSDPDDLGGGPDNGIGDGVPVDRTRAHRSARATVALAIATVVLAVVGTTTAIAQAGRHAVEPGDPGAAASAVPATPPVTSALPVPVSETSQETTTAAPTTRPTTSPRTTTRRTTTASPRPTASRTTRRPTAPPSTARRPSATTRVPAGNTGASDDSDAAGGADAQKVDSSNRPPSGGNARGVNSSNRPPSGL